MKLIGRFRFVFIVMAAFAIVLAADSGKFLVVNQPRRSDVIIVLAGETSQRPARGLELLGQAYASRLILDVPAESKVYQWSEVELARKYVEGLPQASPITICPVYGNSTRDEAQDVSRCLPSVNGQKVLLVTSDYHTRRALSVFRHLLPADYSVAAAFDDREFGVQWWRHRQWAKTNLGEWTKLLWWEVVDRWR